MCVYYRTNYIYILHAGTVFPYEKKHTYLYIYKIIYIYIPAIYELSITYSLG